MKRTSRITAVVAMALSVTAARVHAQYTADFQTNIIGGMASNWVGDYLVGSNTFADVLLIQTNGVLSNALGYVGYELGSSNNSVLVSDQFSLWRSVGSLYMGYSGAGNNLVISNRGVVVNDNGFMGYGSSSSNNCVLVTGNRSLWSNHTNLYVGYSGAGNKLVISNSGSLYSASASIGYNVDATGNSVIISDTGSVWRGSSSTSISGLTIGDSGAGNSLIISNGGQVLGVGTVGNAISSSSNSVFVTGTNSVWKSTSGTLKVGNSGAGNSLKISGGGQVTNGNIYIGGGTSPFHFSSSNNSVVVEGSGSILQMQEELYLGYSGPGNSLVISNGGSVITPNSGVLPNNSYLGYNTGSDNNRALVSGTGSVWSTYDLYFGGPGAFFDSAGANNSLVIEDGGRLLNRNAYLGDGSSSTNNEVLVSGSGSVWSNSGNLYVGYEGAGNSMTINSGSKVFNSDGYLGYAVIFVSRNNRVLVTDPGSVWSNRNTLYFGIWGGGNSMVISNGGRVVDSDCFIGSDCCSSYNSIVVTGTGSVWTSSSQIECDGSDNSLVICSGGHVIGDEGLVGGGSNNNVLVTDSGSVWSNKSWLGVGISGSGNSLVISNGGQVFSIGAIRNCVGCSSSSGSNSVRVVDGGIWKSRFLDVGQSGSSNSLTVSGGSVLATSFTIGLNATTCDNYIQLDTGNVIVTNATHDAVLEVRRGTFILNGGVLQVDKMVMTNACGLFVRNGGTLIVGSLVLDPALDADGDSLPNGWEQAYGLDPLSATGNDGSDGDPDGDGMSNAQEFQAGTNPMADIKSIAREGDDIRVTWGAAAGKTNALQAAAGDGGDYTNNFTDIFTVTNIVSATTNYLDFGAATNFPSRYYRIRLVP